MAASLSDIATIQQNAVKAANSIADSLDATIPHLTSGQLAADALIVPGFVRVTGVSVVAAGAVGGLYDASSLANAASTTQVYTVPATAGFIAVNMVFANGLVYKPGSGQTVAIFYTRT